MAWALGSAYCNWPRRTASRRLPITGSPKTTANAHRNSSKRFSGPVWKRWTFCPRRELTSWLWGTAVPRFFPQELLPYTRRTPIHGGGIRVNFLVNYGWQWDLSHIQQDGYPYSRDISRIDLIIRWGGMRRLSGFLPIQSVYADFYVEDHLWPEYTDSDFLNALEWYAHQDVTRGG